MIARPTDYRFGEHSKKTLTSENSRKPKHPAPEKSSSPGIEPDHLHYSRRKRTLLGEIHHSWPKSTGVSQSKQRNSSPAQVFNPIRAILGDIYENQII
jgi:hypothetical protein